MSLSAHEFIRRFLLHVLPLGLQRIRYYGFLSNRYREAKLNRCRQLLRMKPMMPANTPTQTSVDYRDRYQQLTGHSLHHCPLCGSGHMLTIEQIAPVHTSAVPRCPDTS